MDESSHVRFLAKAKKKPWIQAIFNGRLARLVAAGSPWRITNQRSSRVCQTRKM
jgi:hypothetical protein